MVKRWLGSIAFALAVATLASLAQAAPPVPEGAHGVGAVQRGDARVEASLYADVAAVAPGEPFRLGVLFELDRDWHIYWRNPGESGLATRLAWKAEATRFGETRWPGPAVFREADGFITTYGYAKGVLLTHEATYAGKPGAPLEVSLEADFLVCRVQCVPGTIQLKRSLPVAASSQPAEARTLALFDEWHKRVPVPAEQAGLRLEALYSQSAVRPGDEFKAAVAALCADEDAGCGPLTPGTSDPSAAFVPDVVDSVALKVTGARKHPFAEGFLVTLTGRADADAAQSEQRLRGVLYVDDAAAGEHAVEVDLALPRAPAGAAVTPIDNPWLEPQTSAGFAPTVGLWQAILLAMLGGLILNLMPCVLPVLAIKVFGIAERAHAHRREILAHGAAYTLGILVTMALLAGTVIALRAAGASVGWGFQFQEPLFVAAICAVLVVFALNLFGVFEIGVNSAGLAAVENDATGLRRSFLEGLLAVIVATPCSAPFLGTAVGFAFASSAPVILAIFLAVGLGLAAPFALITLVPGWARLVPRGGPWMNQLRAALGFALIATVVWLLWIVGRSVGSDGMTLLLGFLVVVAALTSIFGALQRRRADGAALPALLLGGVAAIGLVLLPLDASQAPGGGRAEVEPGFVKRFDASAVASELAEGRAVFAYFTADWCLTCKVNERVVLQDASVQERLAGAQISTFKADWTRRDEEIRLELARHGRAGVPMYLVYDPRNPAQPRVLPELLTVDLLLDALQKATPEVRSAATAPEDRI